MQIYSCSPTLSQISLKSSFGKVVLFQILAKIKIMRNKNRLFDSHFETVKLFFFRIMIYYSAYIYGANFIAKFRWKSGFLRGFHGTPHGHQWEWKYLNTLRPRRNEKHALYQPSCKVRPPIEVCFFFLPKLASHKHISIFHHLMHGTN